MEKFRKECITNFKLDPAKYVSLPSWAWDAALKKSKADLDLFKDSEMYGMFENNIRGGISMAVRRYSEANNKYLKDFDPDKPIKYLMYWDMNNLYGDALSQKLPYE